MAYKVFLVSSHGMPQDHHAIFVETNLDGSGYVYQATGSIQQGMVYQTKPVEKPEDDASFLAKEQLGIVTDYTQIDAICSSIPPPKKQFEGPKRLYPNEPLRRCQEWARDAVDALKAAGVIQ